MQHQAPNLFTGGAVAPGTEQFTTLLERDGTRIERIVSNEHSSPEGFWYDQPEDEWVLLVAGEAVLDFDAGAPLHLKAGDHVFIPRHVRHRVLSTSPQAVWLAIQLAAAP